MTNERESEELRREIARTRSDMDRTLAELEDRVSPSRIRERQTQKVRSRWHDARDRVMGSGNGDHNGHRAREHMSDMSQSMQDAAHQAPDRIESATQGNPMAAGMMAFGLGALLGSIFPATRPEEQLATELRDQFEEPVRREFKEAVQESKDELQDHAQQAFEATRDSAQQAAKRTQEEVEDRVIDVSEHAQDAVRSTREQQGGPQQATRQP